PRPALVSGVGERRAPLHAPLPPLALVLASPGPPLATAAVFARYAACPAPRAPRGRLAAQLEALLAAGEEGRPRAPRALLENDPEPPAEELCPAIARVRTALRGSGALAVGLSGSGATLYAVYAGPAESAGALARLRLPQGAWARLART